MSEEAEEALRQGIKFCKVVRNDEKEVVGVDDDDGGEICGCDRCAFRNDAEKGFRGSDDEDEESSSSSEESEDIDEVLVRSGQLGESDEYESASESDADETDDGSESGENENSSDSGDSVN